MNSFAASFDGQLLLRGFWLYVWKIAPPAGNAVYYVGRTGDSSSANAASPFSRLGAHLEMKANAKGNAMYRNLKRANVDPTQCSFRMCAIGPIYPEQSDFETHKVYRDKTAALEYALADALKREGYQVIGTHEWRPLPDSLQETFEGLIGELKKAFAE